MSKSSSNTVPLKRPKPPRQGHPKGLLITVLGLALGLLFVVGSIKELVKLRQTRAELSEARLEEARLAKLKKNLAAREKALHDPRVVQEEARKIGMVRKNEVPIVLPDHQQGAGAPRVPTAVSGSVAVKKPKEKSKGFWEKVKNWFK